MFGRTIVPLGKPPPPRPFPKDRTLPGTKPFEYGLLERRPGSDWPSRALQYEQRRGEIVTHKLGVSDGDVQRRDHRMKWEMASERRELVGKVKRQVGVAMKCYEDNLFKRREKIRVMLLAEDSALERELMDKAQRMKENRFMELKEQADALRRKREAEQAAIVEEKRIQQYRNKYEDLRPRVTQRNLLESKNAQLLQMKDKEMMREEERLRDKMWHEVTMKVLQAKIAREEDDARDRFARDMEGLNVLNLQRAALEEMKTQKQQVRDQEIEDMARLTEELKREEIQRLKDKIAKRDKTAMDLKEQIATREAFLAQRKLEEETMEITFTRLAQAELEREQAAIQDNTERLKREVAMYRENLAEMKKERAMEDAHLEKLIRDVHLEEERKRDANRKEIRAARKKLLDETIKGRRDQIEAQKKKALDEANLKMLEKELSDKIRNTHISIEESHQYNIKHTKEQYRVDLLKQIAFSAELKKREQEELDREFLSGMLEEERYKRLVKEILDRPLQLTPHPFKVALVGEGEAFQGQRDMCPCTPRSIN